MRKGERHIGLNPVVMPPFTDRVPTAQEKQGKWPKKFPVREKTGNLEILPKHRENTGNLVCLGCKFPDSKV